MLHASSVVIVGAGHGGYQTAKSLRDLGYDKPITVLNEDGDMPYQRPPLSKAYLTGKSSLEDLSFAPADYYQAADITLMRNAMVKSIDRQARTVTLSDGSVLPYGHLVLATGTRPRELDVPGSTAEGVFSLRKLADADALAARLAASRDVVVVGAGFIGLEFVSVALAHGKAPVVLEFAPRILGRAASEPVSEYFASYYREQGVTIVPGTGVAEIETAGGAVSAVVDSNGVRHAADMVVVGIGVLPETGLAQRAGLAVENGIVVDESLGTSDPHISAIGDCCSYPSVTAGRMVRLESVQNATDHARCVAAKLVGKPRRYAEIPWFWSDQGPKKLQMAGLNFGSDRQVVRGDVPAGKFSVFLYDGDDLVAVDSVDRPMDHMSARRLMAAGIRLPPEDAADPGFDLKGFALRAQAAATARS
ncbi:3-phenylpropionate/trans-cinnamate dioxygenase ferredoxin reductase subunit [Arthrobacter ginsengisoli]|uniref:3-phenylpropionate/trans-cinnamate dioxygenase ferredoxin reductase subunit n=1 Tax=Arthrobacter ginsengisoli TaxID=1356565 RepID=A0ABU1UG43_9MICC|nr:FAD/NAD(P)-binding oxidoreductase [Arthrobacter ginsengisoli]MDR7084128.1 3-phenylpropionate/trans-cinnamate dioxygenase ferredoxin reductase subunit [Arthrobacter ginsengisoli]